MLALSVIPLHQHHLFLPMYRHPLLQSHYPPPPGIDGGFYNFLSPELRLQNKLSLKDENLLRFTSLIQSGYWDL
jgi:hypothetical protein